MYMIIETIRNRIETSDKTRYRICQESGVSEAQLCRLMQGKTVTVETADTLLKYFEIGLSIKGGAKMRTHKRRNGEATATFEELNFKEQSQSISATISTLYRMIQSHLRRANEEGRDVIEIRRKRFEQVERMVHKGHSR